MSVSDPLLKLLKGHIIKLRTDPNPICDDHPSLQPFCETLEDILRKGTIDRKSVFGSMKTDYWHWIEKLQSNNDGPNRYNPLLSMAINEVKSSSKITSGQGRGRAFLRIALQKKILRVPIEQLSQTPDILVKRYDTEDSIIGDEILREIFMSLLYEVTEVNFRLNLKIVSFLDVTWTIPVYRQYEFVPCEDLGVQLHHMNGRVMVASVDEGGVAAEEKKLEPGDILDELLKEPLRNILKGKIPHLLRINRGFPVYLAVVKCKLPNGLIFPPVANLLQCISQQMPVLRGLYERDVEKRKQLSTKPPPQAQLPQDELDEVPVHDQDKAYYDVRYIAKAVIGEDGSVSQIEKAIARVLETVNPEENPQETKDVHLETGETDVTITEADTNMLLYKHSYTKISSCGRRIDNLRYFAFIAGETTCTLAKNFHAYVFKAKTAEEAKVILCSIAQGFGRTHWFV